MAARSPTKPAAPAKAYVVSTRSATQSFLSVTRILNYKMSQLLNTIRAILIHQRPLGRLDDPNEVNGAYLVNL